MDCRSEQLFEKHRHYILAKAAEFYAVTTNDLIKLGSFESLVFEFSRGTDNFILKLTHSLHRSRDQIMGEVEWVDHLKKNGVSVCGVIPSNNGNPVETIEIEDSYFIAYAFEKAPGNHAEKGQWSNDLILEWGRTLGRIHAATGVFKPSRESYRRFHWYEDDTLNAKKYIPADQRKVISKIEDHKNKLRSWPVDEKSYGLIHSDIHNWNFYVHNGGLRVFDTDDCHYNWLAYDIGIPLYYALRTAEIGDDNVEYARYFFKLFMEGYKKENKIDPVWITRIPDFVKLREMDLYIVITREGIADANDWCRRFMKGRREKIENDVPFLDLDFSEFC
ncbi:MAG: phosphotransferase [Candidatus Zixiibacteriota bacterium]|nr:MAG: phosphotransferase [candidate division Zixibacteria bacterium]